MKVLIAIIYLNYIIMPNTQIAFDSTIMESINEEYLNRLSLTDIQQLIRGNQYSVYYKVVPCPTLVAQSELFAKHICGINPTDYPLSRTQRFSTYDDLIQLTARAYRYSYFKVLWYVLKMYRSGINNFVNFNRESLVFEGHALLYYTLVSKIIRHTDVEHNTVLFRRIDAYESSFSCYTGLNYDIDNNVIESNSEQNATTSLVSSDLSGISFNLDDLDFIDPELEGVLSDLRRNYVDLCIHDLADPIATRGESFSIENPLGEACYSEDCYQINTVCSSGINSIKSKMWNLACGIALYDSNDDQIDSDFYSVVNTSDFDNRNLYFMIEAITGELFGTYGILPRGNGNSEQIDDTMGGYPGPSGSTSTSLHSTNPTLPSGGTNSSLKKTKSLLRKSTNNVINSIRGKTIGNEKFRNFLSDVIKDAGVSAIDNTLKLFIYQIITDKLIDKGITVIEDEQGLSSNLPFLKLSKKQKNKLIMYNDNGKAKNKENKSNT